METNLEVLLNQLNSLQVSGQLEAMKKLVQMLSRGKTQHLSIFLPSVVKLIQTSSLELKRLVFAFVLYFHPMKREKDLILLTVNSLQKELKEKDALRRALGWKMLISISTEELFPLLRNNLDQLIKDQNSFVRKQVAHLLPQLQKLDRDQTLNWSFCFKQLLNDQHITVLGTALTSFWRMKLYKEHSDWLHFCFKRICRLLNDFEEWDLFPILSLLLYYSRLNFKKPTDIEIDSDLSLLLNQCMPLLHHRNQGVVVSVSSLIINLAPIQLQEELVQPLLRLLRSRKEIKSFGLKIILDFIKQSEQHINWFQPHFSCFILQPKESIEIIEKRLEILVILTTKDYLELLFRESQFYLKSENSEVVAACLRALKKLAIKFPDYQEHILAAVWPLRFEVEDLIIQKEFMSLIRYLLFSIILPLSVPLPEKVEDKQQELYSSFLDPLLKLSHSIIKSKNDLVKINYFVILSRFSGFYLLLQSENSIPFEAVLYKISQIYLQQSSQVKLQIIYLFISSFSIIFHSSSLKDSEQYKTVKHFLELLLTWNRFDLDYELRTRVQFLVRLCFGQQLNESESISFSVTFAQPPHPIPLSLIESLLFQMPTEKWINPTSSGFRYDLNNFWINKNSYVNIDTLPEFPKETINQEFRATPEPSSPPRKTPEPEVKNEVIKETDTKPKIENKSSERSPMLSPKTSHKLGVPAAPLLSKPFLKFRPSSSGGESYRSVLSRSKYQTLEEFLSSEDEDLSENGTDDDDDLEENVKK